MALYMYYKRDDSFVLISQGTNLTAPFTSTHDGRNGDTQTFQLYLRNNNSSLWYSNIRVYPRDLEDANPYGDVIYTETGWGVKLSAEEEEPSSGEWNSIEWGNTISLSNIGSNDAGDISTYVPFWYYITCPPNIEAVTKTDIVLNVSYTENAVT